jgi:uncharacterized cupredoxin-like copper-binding protein
VIGRNIVSVALAVAWLAPGPGFAQERARHAAHDASGHAHAAVAGTPGDAARATRTIDIDMTDDMRFSPVSIHVKRGETVRFRVTNRGRLTHEMVIGSPRELREHAAQMRKSPGMTHAEPNQATAEAGATRELVWTFSQAGSIGFACLQPGHYEAGMRGTVVVRP